MGLIGVCIMPMTFPIIIDHKQCKEDDGDYLQNQGHDGELQPHVGGVRRHPRTDSAYLLQPDTHTHAHALTLPVCAIYLSLFKGLCCVKGGRKVVSGFKVMQGFF